MANHSRSSLDQALLKGGDDWRQEIHTWMGLCHSALVLFSPGVSARPDWVRKEAAILEWRQTLDPGFVLIPVLLPGFAIDQLGQLGLNPVFLQRLQLVEGDTADALFDQIKALLQPLLGKAQRDAPLRKLVNQLEALLGSLTPAQCEDAVADLGGDVRPWSAQVSPQEHLARTLLEAPLDDVVRVLAEAQFVLGRAGVLKVFDLLSAFWVQPEAAARLPEVVARAPSRRAAAVNSLRPETGRFYIWRGLGRYPPGCKAFDLLNQFNENPAKEAQEQVFKHFRAKLPDLKDEEIQRQVDRFCGPTSAEPVFLLLAGPVPPATLRLLQDAFPGCTFLLLSPESFAHRADYAANPVEFLEPELKPEDELRFVDTKSDLQLSL